jgi:phage terminase large subunit-like protein
VGGPSVPARGLAGASRPANLRLAPPQGWTPPLSVRAALGAAQEWEDRARCRLAHLLTIGDEEPGAQVYSHALDGKQAALCYENAARMVALSAQLSKIYTVTKTGMIDEGSMSSFRPLSGEAYGKHGLSPHANIGDEAHAWRNGNLHTFLIQGMGARRQPLDITISTAGEIKTYGHELYLASKAIFENPDLDPETYVSIYEAAPEDDWTDPKVWAKANPNLGVSLKPEFLEAECKRAQQTPRLENDFKRYHLNLWVEQATRWLAMKLWPANTIAPNDKEHWKKLPALMGARKGKPVFAGLDLGSTSDITALIWIFPPENDSDRVTLVCRFWVPEDRVAERDSVRTPYKKWVADGALLTTPGNVTDYDFIEFKIIEDVALFGLTGMGFDPWNATQVVTHLQEEGCRSSRSARASPRSIPVRKNWNGCFNPGSSSTAIIRSCNGCSATPRSARTRRATSSRTRNARRKRSTAYPCSIRRRKTRTRVWQTLPRGCLMRWAAVRRMLVRA